MVNINEVLIEPIAYLRMIRHARRFWNGTIPEEKRRRVYGALIGYVEEGVRYIMDYVPLLHSSYEIDFERKHSVFIKLDKLNRDLASEEEPDYILGWVKSIPSDTVEVTEIDKKNMIYMQTVYHPSAVLVYLMLPALDYDFGIEVRSFVDPIYTLDMNSVLADLTWDFDEVIDMDELFYTIKDLYETVRGKKELIKEYGEPTVKIKK